MNSAAPAKQGIDTVAVRAWVEGRSILLELKDGRILSFPAARFRRLRDASEADLRKVRIELGGTALRWEELDEDLTVQGVVAGGSGLPSAASGRRGPV